VNNGKLDGYGGIKAGANRETRRHEPVPHCGPRRLCGSSFHNRYHR